MAEGKTCTNVLPGGADCYDPVPPDSPVTLCVNHLREAYLHFCDYLAAIRDFSEEHRELWERRGYQVYKGPDLRQSFVYYIRIGNHIKIGTTKDFPSRMSLLQPDEILALELGGVDVERQRHRQFCQMRASKGREYFQPGTELLDHIATLNADTPTSEALLDEAINGLYSQAIFTLPTKRSSEGEAVTDVDLDARLTPSQAAQLAGVSRQLINWWKREGKLTQGEDGTYRAGDVLLVERDTRRSPYSSRTRAA